MTASEHYDGVDPEVHRRALVNFESSTGLVDDMTVVWVGQTGGVEGRVLSTFVVLSRI